DPAPPAGRDRGTHPAGQARTAEPARPPEPAGRSGAVAIRHVDRGDGHDEPAPDARADRADEPRPPRGDRPPQRGGTGRDEPRPRSGDGRPVRGGTRRDAEDPRPLDGPLRKGARAPKRARASGFSATRPPAAWSTRRRPRPPAEPRP